MRVFLDFETFSAADLRKVGTWRYAEDPSTELLCLAWAIEVSEPKLWTPVHEAPHALFELIASGAEVWAWNAHFEAAIWMRVCHERMGWPAVPVDRWRCSMALALSHSLPGALDKCAQVLRAKEQKSSDGQYLIHKLCKPRKPSKGNPELRWTPRTAPDDFSRLYGYCKQDVRAETVVHARLPSAVLSAHEQTIWTEDLRSAIRGVDVDLASVRSIIAERDKYLRSSSAKMQRTTGAEATQRDKLLAWLHGEGFPLANLKAETVTRALEADLPAHVRAVLELRASVSQASVAKLDKMLACACRDGRLRGMTQYHGAGTGRWAGRLVQLQNLPSRGVPKSVHVLADQGLFDWETLELIYGDPMWAYSSMIRSMLTAGTRDLELVAVDFSAIEARLIGWLAGASALVDGFRAGVDWYSRMAAKVYRIGEGEVQKDVHRPLGKQIILGCGYQMGPEKFRASCEGQGIEIGEELAEEAVATYRSTFPEIPAYWKALQRAALAAVQSPGLTLSVGPVAFRCGREWLQIKLPSGRKLSYYAPRVEEGRYGLQVTYETVDSYTRKWKRVSTYGGKLAENVTQAVARDIMADAIPRMASTPYRYLFSVHDELVALAPAGTGAQGLVEIMVATPAWAAGAPIKAEGWAGFRYRK